jgi:hypothetical protein
MISLKIRVWIGYLCKFTILEWVETRVYETMATPPLDPLAVTTPTVKTVAPPVEEGPKMVTVEVITDTPVNRVRKGGTLSLPIEIAEQFVASELVRIVKDPAS